MPSMQPLTRLFVIPPLLRRLLLLLLLLLQLQLQLSSKMILASPLESSSAFINRQYLFRLASSATTANGSLPDTMIRQVQTFIHQHTGLSVDISTISQIRTAFHGLLVQTNIPLPLDSIVSALQLQLPFIESIERDHKWSSTQVQSGLSGLGWGLDRIDQASNQLDGNYKFDSAGKGVNIYVVDSGIDADHPEFDGRAKSVYNSPRFTDGIDCQSHGTHVAGIAGGTNVGVAKLANLNAVRVVDCNGVTSTMEIVAALDWILANHKKPAVVSMSLGPDLQANGQYPRSAALDQAVRALVNAGVSVVVAAGNDNANPCQSAPAGSDGVLAVAASNLADRRASFSNHGDCIALFAPGVDIFSAVPRSMAASASLSDPLALLNGESKPYRKKSGTSQATPFVAGVIALYLEKNPQASAWDVKSALHNAAVKTVIQDSKMSQPLLLQSVSIPTPGSAGELLQLVSLVSLDSLGGFEWTALKIAIVVLFTISFLAAVGLIYWVFVIRRRRNRQTKELFDIPQQQQQQIVIEQTH